MLISGPCIGKGTVIISLFSHFGPLDCKRHSNYKVFRSFWQPTQLSLPRLSISGLHRRGPEPYRLDALGGLSEACRRLAGPTPFLAGPNCKKHSNYMLICTPHVICGRYVDGRWTVWGGGTHGLFYPWARQENAAIMPQTGPPPLARATATKRNRRLDHSRNLRHPIHQTKDQRHLHKHDNNTE